MRRRQPDHSGPLIDESSVTRSVLPNGLTVIVQEDHSAPTVAIVTYVKAGYFDETDDEIGISHVLEHMFFKGTPTRAVGEIARDTKGAGGYLNAHTIYDNTTYYAVLPASALRRGLEIQADAYKNSSIEAGELAREIQVIIEEAKRKEDNAPAVALETLFELMHDRHRIRRWRIGREAQLRSFTRQDVLRFYRNFYTPGNTILSISGDVNPGDALRMVTEHYGQLADGAVRRKPGLPEPERREFRFREISGDISQSQFLIGWRTPGTTHPDTPALDVASSILASGRASRLYRSVRERGLAASISCSNHTPGELGVFAVHGEAEPEKTVDALRASWSEVAAIALENVGADELRRIGSVFEAHAARRLETAQGRANHLAEWEALGGWRLGDEYHRAFLSTKPGDVARVARNYLAPDQGAVLVYRPEGAAVTARNASEMRDILSAAPPVVHRSTAVPIVPDLVASPVQLEEERAGVLVFRTVTGLPILVQRKRSPITYLSAHAVGGAVEDPAALAGRTLIGSRMLLKGTLTRTADEIAEASETLGVSLGSSSGRDGFGWSLSVPTANFGKAVELFGEILSRPSFPALALEIERSVALSNLALLRDDMYRYPVRLAVGAAFAGHPYGIPVTGTEESLQALSVEHLRHWHEQHVLSSQIAVGIVGDVDPRQAAGLVAGALRSFAYSRSGFPDPPSWGTGPRMNAESRDKAQTALALAFPGPSRNDRTRFAGYILSTIASGLGGRFFEELRDKRSLAYTVNLSAQAMALTGMFEAYIATSPTRETLARDALLAEFQRFCEAPVTEDELARSKEYLIGSRAISHESGGAVLGEMLDAWLFGKGLDELLEHDEQVRRVSADDVQSVARSCFHPEWVVEGVVRGSTSDRSR